MPENLASAKLPALHRTGDEGIEPPPKVLETPIIPLDQSPVRVHRTRYLYHILVGDVKWYRVNYSQIIRFYRFYKFAVFCVVYLTIYGYNVLNKYLDGCFLDKSYI